MRPTGLIGVSAAFAISIMSFAQAEALGRKSALSVVGERSVMQLVEAVGESLATTDITVESRLDTLDPEIAALRFCAGVGKGTPDVLVLPRTLREEEGRRCREAGTEPVELKIGYQTALLVTADADLPRTLTRRQVFEAVARDAPYGSDQILRPNDKLNWSQVAPDLPDRPIYILGAARRTPLWEVFSDLVIKSGARDFSRLGSLAASDPASFERIAEAVRGDGRFIEAPQDPVARVLDRDAPSALAIVEFQTYAAFAESLRPVAIEAVEPTKESIRSGAYPGARGVYVYLKPEHAPFSPALVAFAQRLADPDILGEAGTIEALGLVPVSESDREKMRRAVLAFALRPN